MLLDKATISCAAIFEIIDAPVVFVAQLKSTISSPLKITKVAVSLHSGGMIAKAYQSKFGVWIPA